MKVSRDRIQEEEDEQNSQALFYNQISDALKSSSWVYSSSFLHSFTLSNFFRFKYQYFNIFPNFFSFVIHLDLNSSLNLVGLSVKAWNVVGDHTEEWTLLLKKLWRWKIKTKKFWPKWKKKTLMLLPKKWRLYTNKRQLLLSLLFEVAIKEQVQLCHLPALKRNFWNLRMTEFFYRKIKTWYLDLISSYFNCQSNNAFNNHLCISAGKERKRNERVRTEELKLELIVKHKTKKIFGCGSDLWSFLR